MRRRSRSRARWTTCWTRLWESGGPVVSRIGAVGAVAPFRVPDDVVLRELAALALAHSKSMVPATLLRRLPALPKGVAASGPRRARRSSARRGAPEPGRRACRTPLGANARWYADPVDDAFAWLDSPDPAHRALADRRRRRRAAGSRGRCAAPARHDAANGRRVRDLHRRRDGPGGVLAPHRGRRPAVSSSCRQPAQRRRGEPPKGAW